MLKHRLIFGCIMIVVLIFLLWLDAGFSFAFTEGVDIQATVLAILLGLIAIPAVFEIKKLSSQKGMVIFAPIAIIGSVLLSLSWYVRQYVAVGQDFGFYYLACVITFVFFASYIYQAKRFGTEGTFLNCSVNIFAVIYLGFLSSFMLGIRIDFGFWALIMTIVTVKSSDIGAYTVGRIFGKHKLAPRISPGKTWEGMIGACIFAAIVGAGFASKISELALWHGIVFGVVFAFIGQLGDLVESMLKRDSQLKDSASSIPGFGGVLDIIDSPLVAAPFAYAFFSIVNARVI